MKPTDRNAFSPPYREEEEVQADLARLQRAAEQRNPGVLDMLEVYGRYQEFALVLQQYDRLRHVTGATTAAQTSCKT